MIPGEYLLGDGDIVANEGRRTVELTVANTGDRPIQVGSHFHFFEANRALLTRPKLLILDEPTEGIQPSIILEIEDAIRRIKTERGLTVLLVEQYLDFAERLADSYVILAKGSVVAAGATKDLKVEVVKHHLAV